MQNKCGGGCRNGFVAADGNWDFNMADGCSARQNHGGRNDRSRACGDECANNSTRAVRRERDCQCERCGDSREAERCRENTYIRREDASCERERTANCTHRQDCSCETCVRSRANCSRQQESCADKTYGGSSCSTCADCQQERTACDRSGKKCVGMISADMQEIDQIYESESALRAGTLFPELHKPLNGYCPCDGNCGTCGQAAAFAAWELRLYLNTHPDDKEALARFRMLCKEAGDESYATAFLPDGSCTGGWEWIRNPWPWEYDCSCGD